MRGALVFLIVLGSLPYCLQMPWIGVLMFSWLSYMNPHRYAWGPVRDFPLAFIVAVVTLAGMLITKDKWRLPKTPDVMLLLALWCLFVITTVFSLNPRDAWDYLERVSKILLMTFATIILINSPNKLRFLLLVIALSVGLIGLKGGIWAIASGGASRVYGPDQSFLADNNDVALGLNMALPLMLYLSKDEPRQWLRWGLRACFLASIVAIIFTYSRGGFLALALVGFMLLLKARYKSLAVVTLAIGIAVLTIIVPQKWTTRMHTIDNYEEDASAMGRINVWYTAFYLALDRPLVGGGFKPWIQPVFDRYAPQPWNVRDVHSSYFEMLGEHGFIGLALYLMLLAYTLLSLTWLKWTINRHADLHWARYYPDMLQVAILGYMLGGAFLGRAYFDLFYHLVAATTILRKLVLDRIAAKEPAKGRLLPGYLRAVPRPLLVAGASSRMIEK